VCFSFYYKLRVITFQGGAARAETSRKGNKRQRRMERELAGAQTDK